MEGPEMRDQANNLTSAAATEQTRLDPVSFAIDGRERIKIEFYKTYDVMTGIRIAATLGGFFSMMILLVLYKNYCKPNKTLSEEQLNAAVTAAVEEEDRALKAALEATSFYTSLTKHRQSMANESAATYSPRFSSVGGGCSHLAPPVRCSYLQQRGKSLPGSVLRFTSDEQQQQQQQQQSKGSRKQPERDADVEEEFDADCPLPDYFTSCNYLSVPPDRRSSSVTCSSADTSYLERRGSAFEMGLPAPPCFLRGDVDKRKVDEEGPWDFYYPIDIQVIQPTPETSPAGSTETLYEKPRTTCGLQVPGFNDRMHRLSSDSSETGLAPLASISSIASLGSEGAATSAENRAATSGNNEDSVGSDSVFMDEEIDTEDEVEEFTTDSEFDYDGFDDDYSFCESGSRSVGRCRKSGLQFASFDSYDNSIGRDTLPSEDGEMGRSGGEKSGPVRRQFSATQDGTRVKRKLCKTHSEPRTRKVPKHLPPWIEKGYSGYVPRRQMSMPGSRRKGALEESDARGTQPDVAFPNPANASGESDVVVVELTAPPQGVRRDKTSQKPDEKRKRFQKQKTINEWCPVSEDGSDRSGECPNGSRRAKGPTLTVPRVSVDGGSCERLNVLRESDGTVATDDRDTC